jgi:ERCC4-related helicase
MNHLQEYFNKLDQSKFSEIDSLLQKLYLETKERMEKNIQEAGKPENPLLKTLKKTIIDFHTKTVAEENEAKGILFTRTRDYADALKRWMEETAELKKILKPEVLLGSGE